MHKLDMAGEMAATRLGRVAAVLGLVAAAGAVTRRRGRRTAGARTGRPR